MKPEENLIKDLSKKLQLDKYLTKESIEKLTSPELIEKANKAKNFKEIQDIINDFGFCKLGADEKGQPIVIDDGPALEQKLLIEEVMQSNEISSDILKEKAQKLINMEPRYDMPRAPSSSKASRTSSTTIGGGLGAAVGVAFAGAAGSAAVAAGVPVAIGVGAVIAVGAAAGAAGAAFGEYMKGDD